MPLNSMSDHVTVSDGIDIASGVLGQ